MWKTPVLALILLGSCRKDSSGPGSTAHVVGLFSDSLTPASRLYQSPWWALYILVVGADADHSGIANQGTVGRDEVGRFGRCLGPAGQLPGERQLAYVALGDTLYTYEDPGNGDMPTDTAYWRLVNRLAQGHDSLRVVLDSALRGDLAGRIPGLVAFSTGLFNPTASAYGRGATGETAILRRWQWTDADRQFFEDTARASLTTCGLR